MDILSDLLRETGLKRRVLDVHRVPDREALRFPCDRSVGFHVVLSGVLYIHTSEATPPLRLEAGDIAVMARGCPHLLSASAQPNTLPVIELTASGDVMPSFGAATQANDGDVRVVSGAYQLWNTPLHPFFAEWPAWHVVRASRTASLDPVQLSVNMIAAEMRSDAMGRETVVHGLLDVLFTHLLRDIAEQRAQHGGGFSQAVRDPVVKRVVMLMHGDCAHDWTLESLARAASISRSVLAERFRTVMQDTPLAYLRTVRLQKAMRLLAESDDTLERIATQVGYRDAFAFSKAFKRAAGISPGEFRRRDAADRKIAWRFDGEVARGAG